MRIADRLLAGTFLALAAAPLSAQSAPRILQSEPPPPLMLRSPQRQTPPLTQSAPQIQQHNADAMNSRAQVTTPAVAAPAPQAAPVAAAPAPAPAETTNGGLVQNAIDRVFGASDAQVTDALRKTRVDNAITRETDRKGVEAFYKSRNYAPLWIKDGALSPRAKAVIARINNIGADALDPSDYPVPSFSGGADALAEDELKMTNTVLTLSRHMQMGRIAPTRVSAEVDYGTKPPEATDILRKMADASNADAAIDSFNPPHAGFKALKNQLAALKSNASVGEDQRIPNGPDVKPGMKDPRIPMLRAKLGTPGKTDDLVYDKALVDAVNRVQARADIKGKGILDDKAIGLINGPKASDNIQTIEANMERWRWLPRDLGRTYVMVNVPDYTLKVVKDNDIVWRTKIVSGKPSNPTPLLTANMQTVVVNPSWFVPQSIIQNELLPQYEKDPQIFDRMGLEVRRGPDGNINVVQPPGAANALGRIKFNFPNRFQVYLHDTPEKKLFSYEKRAFSHGCMRVEDPTKF
ncbi:MAG: L,D-transpeptidase family protein, partial [Pseudolabrys sp.]|nr:L,D-transpeptidase family protein [Pseudolabrys sp.]